MKITKFMIIGTAFFTMLLGHAPVVVASELLFSETFDTSDLSKWNVIQGNSAYWQVANGKATATITTPQTVTMLQPKTEYLSNNDAYETSIEMTPIQGADRNFAFAITNASNFYELHFVNPNMYVSKNGQWSKTIPNVNLYDNVTYKISAVFNKGKIAIKINDLAIAQLEDANYNGEKTSIALRAGTGAVYPTKVMFDNIVVKTLDEDQGLAVPLIKQSQAPWGPLEYDTASKWSSGGISFTDWGCALTRAVMVMKYHGITKMPDGLEVTPLTVNNWLLTHQGYINGGYVSFPSIARLTKEISDKYATPKLEIAKIVETDKAVARAVAVTEIGAQRPVILGIPGHFMVGGGVINAGADFWIKDPSFSRTKLSEHTATLASVRTLTPSQTDLSYLEIAAPTDTQMELLSADGTSQPLSASEEYLTSDSDPTLTTAKFKLFELAKPGDGAYQLKVTRTEASQTAEITVRTYLQTGELTEQAIPAGATQATLQYSKTVPSQLVVQVPTDSRNFSYFKGVVEQLWKTRDIKQELAFQVLHFLATIGEESDRNEQVIVAKVIKKFTTILPPKIYLTTLAKNTLHKEIETLIKVLSKDSKDKEKPKPAFILRPDSKS